MAIKALGEKGDREVGKRLSAGEVQEGRGFDVVYSELVGKLPSSLNEVFATWVMLYAENDEQRTRKIYDVIRDAVSQYGEFFVVSFFICGTRWIEMNFSQFCQIFRVMDQAYWKKRGGEKKRKKAEVEVAARHAGGNTGAKLMRLFLDHKISDPERVDFLRGVLVEKGDKVAEDMCFLLGLPYFRREYFEEAANLLSVVPLEMAYGYVRACESWNLDVAEAVKLSTNLTYLMSNKGGSDTCKKLLQKVGKPDFLGEGNDQYH